MSTPTTLDFTTLVRNQITAIQAICASLVNFTTGSILRSIVEANAAICLWLQGLILQLLATTRASTSTDTDLDSWMADFGLTRLAAVAASGPVTFSRFTPTNQAVIPVGTTVETTDGTEAFAVTADSGNPAFNIGLNAYVVAALTASVTVPVQATAPGSGGNVAANTIMLLASAIPGIDTVTNAAPFANGIDAESDSDFRSRFVNYINSLSKATLAAVGAAIQNVQQGLTYTITENVDYSGAADMGYFYVVVDDGSGAPPTPLLNSIGNAVDLVRPIGSSFGIFAPILLTANVSMTITTDTGYTHADVVADVTAGLNAYIDTLPLGGSLRYTRLAQIAYDISPGVINVTAVLLNAGTSDLAATPKQVIKSGTIAVA